MAIILAMSLEGEREPTLGDLKGRLETIQSAWSLARTPVQRAEINQDFKQLAEEIKQKFGADGKKVVDYVVSKHMALQRPKA